MSLKSTMNFIKALPGSRLKIKPKRLHGIIAQHVDKMSYDACTTSSGELIRKNAHMLFNYNRFMAEFLFMLRCMRSK